jgi:hypothetical protein
VLADPTEKGDPMHRAGGPKSLRFRKRRFIKRNSRWLTFAGAFVIVATFVAKEGLGEYWKETAAKIDFATAMYGIHIDLADTKLLLKARTVVGQAPKNGTVIEQANVSDARVEKDAETLYADAETRWQASQILADSMPPLESSTADLKSSAEKEMSEFKTQMENLSKTAGKLREPPDPKLLMENLQRIVEITAIASRSITAMNKWNNVILAHALEVRRKNEKRAQYAWWISAALFGTGWTLGLLGKLYDIPSAASAE